MEAFEQRIEERMRVFPNGRECRISRPMHPAVQQPESEDARHARRPDDSMQALQEALGERYLLERELGKGGMGVVYLAWETALERRVALKILPPAIANKRRRERFLREARIAARLEHDHIVPIHAVDEAGPFVYYTMQYIRGETLAKRIMAEGPLPVGEVTRILHDVARAVHYAHEQGVIHRDLKPENILIERESGRPYVADFGIARVVGGGLLPGASGAGAARRTLGTFAYVSPEQAAGFPSDCRSDIYSLGVVGYVLATGRPLYFGSPQEILTQHICAAPPPLPVLNRHLDPTLARAVARCLAKDPRRRFQTAGELARALSQAPELRSDLPPPLRDLVAALKLQARSATGGILLGVADLGLLAWALEAGHRGTAAGALGFLGLLAASPVIGALPATRRLLRQGYGRADIVHALNVDLDCQRELLASRWGRATDAASKVVRHVVAFALGLFGLGTLAAASGVDLPVGVVLGSMIGGAFTTVVAGGVLAVRERRRNELAGLRWLRFFESRLGKRVVKLAGIGLGPLPREPELDARPAGLALAAGSADATGSEPEELADVKALAQSCVDRLKAYLGESSATRTVDGGKPTPEELEFEDTLERQVAVLETLLARFLEVEAEAGGSGSLAADLEAARAVCEAVQWLIEGKQLGAGWPPWEGEPWG